MSETLLKPTMNGMRAHFAARSAVPSAIAPTSRFTPAKLDMLRPAGVNARQVDEGNLQPAPHHRWHAGARLRLRLMAWAEPTVCYGSTDSITTALLGNTAPSRHLADAAVKAAVALRLHNSDIVLARLDRLALGAASAEALREHLLEPAKRVVRLLAAQGVADAETPQMLRQTGSMLIAVLSETGARLREADDASTDILLALAEIDTTTTLVRACCAGLMRRYPGLPQMLAGWASIDGAVGFDTMLATTHTFLMASSMRQTMQSPEVADDRMEQIRPVRHPGRGTVAPFGREQ